MSRSFAVGNVPLLDLVNTDIRDNINTDFVERVVDVDSSSSKMSMYCLTVKKTIGAGNELIDSYLQEAKQPQMFFAVYGFVLRPADHLLDGGRGGDDSFVRPTYCDSLPEYLGPDLLLYQSPWERNFAMYSKVFCPAGGGKVKDHSDQDHEDV